MAPKRGAKPQAKLVSGDVLYKNLALTDALCPICRYILILPVTLPCQHNFCSACFDGTVANANLTCPLCRVRFASWLRIAKKEDKLVNCQLWLEVQSQFGDKVHNRQNGIDESLEEAAPIRLTSAGEIRSEYELEKRRHTEEIAREREAEERASTALIEKLQKEDEVARSAQEAMLRLDEKVAREITLEGGGAQLHPNTPKKRPLDKLIQNMKSNVVPKLNNAQPHEAKVKTELPQSSSSSSNSSSTSSSKSAKVVSGKDEAGDKEKSAKQKNLMNFSDVVEVSDSNDSIENECRYFKPIDHRNIPPSHAGSPLKVTAVFPKTTNYKLESPCISNNHFETGGQSAFARFSIPTRKRKLSETSMRGRLLKKPAHETTQATATVTMVTATTCTTQPHMMQLRERKASNAVSPTPQPSTSTITATLLDTIQASLQQKKSGEDAERCRLEQERADLAFAKKLQEEFNKERYTTRSSITCRNNMKKARQMTLTEILSTTSKCK